MKMLRPSMRADVLTIFHHVRYNICLRMAGQKKLVEDMNIKLSELRAES